MDAAHIDSALVALASEKATWARLDIRDKISMLDDLKTRASKQTTRWVEAAVKAKGLAMDSPLAGEEWLAGPYGFLDALNALGVTLRRIAASEDVLAGFTVSSRIGGQVVVKVSPLSLSDRILFSGSSAEVWMQPDVTIETLPGTIGEFYRRPQPDGAVCLVLGAGNVASIPPLDVINKLYNEGQVTLLKMNPVNEYLGEILEEIFADFIDAGFVRFVYGSADVGAFLTTHDDVDNIHVTGSARTYNAIRYGHGQDGERNRLSDTPINSKPISAELGGISPTIVVPGDWSRADLRFQADNVVTSKMNNSGFNCIATQVLVLPESWELADSFLDEIREVLREMADRDAYYPGVEDRCEAIVSGSGDVETFGGSAPRFLVTGLDPTNAVEAAFTTEYFAPALSVVTLPSQDVPSYVSAATTFANETLAGTLGASIIVHPKTEKAYPAAIDNMVESLQYGGIGINTWSAAAYLNARCVWGAFPGHTPSDIGSGVGVVHNALMFSRAQKSVARAPFAPSHRTLSKGEFHIAPKPVFFLSNKQSHTTSQHLVDYTISGKTTDLMKVVASAIRG